MTGNALERAFSLLLLASITQGLQDTELSCPKAVEAVVGQNLTIPCYVNSSTHFTINSIEWLKKNKETTKLVLLSVGLGQNHFWPNVTIEAFKNDANKLIGSYLHLPELNKWDNGTYICDIATFPMGSMKAEIKLTIKDDIQITCNVDGAVKVHNGENVTIRCRGLPDAQYRWTKNEQLVSESDSLELWWVTAADAGLYTLSVSAGNKSLREDFNVTVLPATTSVRTDLETVTPRGSTESADGSLTTSPTTGLSTRVNWATSISTSNTDTSSVTITAAEPVTSSAYSTHIGVTASPATRSDTYHSLNSSTSRYGPTGFGSTAETSESRNESRPHTLRPEDIFSPRPEASSTVGNVSEDSENPTATPTLSATAAAAVSDNKDSVRHHLLLVLLIVPVLVLVAVVGFLCRRQVIKKRMDLPPSFKPPPPPVKYTAVKHSETSPQPLPTSRCNSVVEPKRMTTNNNETIV